MAKAFLERVPERYWHQRRMECGAYVMKAVLNLYGKDGREEPKAYLSFIGNLCYGFTSPLRIIRVLRSYGLEAQLKTAKHRRRRLDILKAYLDRQEPVILLVGNSFNSKRKYRHFRRAFAMHWVLLLGYDDSQGRVYLYNPRVREEDQESLPVGNVSLPYRLFMKQWRGLFLTGMVNYLYLPVSDHQ